MAWMSDKFRIFDGDMQLKRTARKSTFVPKKVSGTSSGSSPEMKSLKYDNREFFSRTQTSKIKENGTNVVFKASYLDDNILDSEAQPTVAKYNSVEEMQAVQIRKLQTARKSFQSSNNYATASSSLAESKDSALSSFKFSHANGSVINHQHSTELKSVVAPTIKKNLKVSLRNVPNNGADLKIPVVKLERDIKGVYKRIKRLKDNKCSSENFTKRANDLDGDDEIAIPAARGCEDELTIRPIMRFPVQQHSEHVRGKSLTAARETLESHNENFTFNSRDLKFSNDKQKCISPRKGENIQSEDTQAIDKMLLGDGVAADEDDSDFNFLAVRPHKRQGRKRKKRRKSSRHSTKSLILVSDENTSVVFKHSTSPAKLQAGINCFPDVKQSNEPEPLILTSRSDFGNVSLIQHLPNIDYIDDVKFLSFETEDDLQRFVKRYPSYILDFNGKNGATRFLGAPITLTKTKDFTKIKGWRNKVFASDMQPIEARNADIDRNRLEKALLEQRIDYKIYDRTPDKIHDDDIKDEHGEESLDLDVDIYDDSRGVVEDDAKNKNEHLASHSPHFDEEVSNVSQLSPNESAPVASFGLDDKSAFVSELLDDFLRNKAELKTSLTVSKEKESCDNKIDTKVVWPTNAVSPNTEMSKIKPPPFSTRKPVQRVLKELFKTSNNATHKPQREDMHNVSVKSFEKLNATVNSVEKLNETVQSGVPHQNLKRINNSFKLTELSFPQAFRAAQAVIEPKSMRRSSPVVKIKVPRFELPVGWNQVVNPSVRKELKGNFLVTVTNQMAAIAASACNITRNNSVVPSDKLRAVSDSTTTDAKKNSMQNMTLTKVKRESDMQNISEMDVQPPSPYQNAENPVPISELNKDCDKDFCQLGCVCESIKVSKRKRKHCGKEHCMLDCTCKTNDKNQCSSTCGADLSSRHKRPIRLPARLKDSFLWNGGRDLPLSFDWDMSVHRKSEIKDDSTRLLWKEGAKCNDSHMRVRKRGVNRMNMRLIKPIGDSRTLNNNSDRVNNSTIVNLNSPSKASVKASDRATHYAPNYYNQQERTKLLLQQNSGSESYKRSILRRDSGGVENSRNNLLKALYKQLPNNYVHDQRTDLRRPSYPQPVGNAGGVKGNEPNLMLPHDWRFVSKSPEENPELKQQRRQATLSSDREKFADRNKALERSQMKMNFKRLKKLVEPLTNKLKLQNPETLINTSFVLAMGTLMVKRLKQQEIELVNLKRQLVNKRIGLLHYFEKHLTGHDVEKQKSMAKSLAIRLQTCCSVNQNRQSCGFLNRDANKVVASFSQCNFGNWTNQSSTVKTNQCVEEHLSDYSAADIDENLLEEPKVVIENDLDDVGSDKDSPVVDIYSAGGDKVQNYVENRPHISTAASTSRSVSRVRPSVGQWKQLLPNSTVTERQLNFTGSSETIYRNSRTSSNNDENTRRRGSYRNMHRGFHSAQDFNREPQLRNLLITGRKNAGAKQLPTHREVVTGTGDNQKGFINIVSGIRPGESSRFVLLPMDAKMIPNDVEKQFPTITSQIRAHCSSNAEYKSTKLSENNLTPACGSNNNRNYATILIPVNMLPGTNSGDDRKSAIGMPPKMILQPIVSGPIYTSGYNADSRKGIFAKEEISCTNAPINAKSQVNLTINHTNVVNPLSQLKASDDRESVRGSLSTGNHNGIAMAVEGRDTVTNSLKLNGNSCINDSLISSSHSLCATEQSVEVSISSLADSTVDENAAVDDVNSLIDGELNDEDFSDLLGETEEMPKIINLVTITEDEFRCKDETLESITI